MEPIEIVPIHVGAHAYLIKSANHVILVDTGHRNKSDAICKVMEQHNLVPQDIKLIICTHTHHDHVGSLYEMQQRSGAKVMVHMLEADNLRRGNTPLPKGTNAYARFVVMLGRSLFKKISRYKPVFPNIILSGAYDLEPFGFSGKVLPTPGHTSGSVSVILNSGDALVGDTLFNITPRTIFPPFANNPDVLMASWKLLLDTPARRFYPAHGRMIQRQTLEQNYKIYKERIIPASNGES